MSNIDEVAPFESDPQLSIFQTTFQDASLDIIFIAHLEATIECSFVGQAVTKDYRNGVSYSIAARCEIVDLLNVHVAIRF